MLSYTFSKAKISLYTCPAVKMATFLSFWPRKAMLLVGKLFSCSAFPVARSKIQYRTQFPVFKTACTPSEIQMFKKKLLYIFSKWQVPTKLYISSHISNTDTFHSILLHFILSPLTAQALKEYTVLQLEKLQNLYLWNPHSLLIFLSSQVYKAS